MSGSRSAPKRAVSAIKRAWTNKVLSRAGRRGRAADETAEPAFQSNPAYAAPLEVGSPQSVNRPFAGNSRSAQFARALTVVTGEAAVEASADFVRPMVGDDLAMLDLATGITEDQLDQELKVDGKLKTGTDLATAQNALFRSSNNWARVGVAYVKAEPEGQTFLLGLQEVARTEIAKLSGSAELRPLELRKELGVEQDLNSNDVTPGIEDLFAERAGPVKDLTVAVLDRVMKLKVPKSVLVMVGTTVRAARKAHVDENEVRKLVGAFVVLRIVNPALVDAVSLPDPSGRTGSPDQIRLMTNITKATLNMANGVAGVGKEPFLKVLMDALESRKDEMDEWFDTIAEDGLELIGALTASRTLPDDDPASTDQAPLGPQNKGKERLDQSVS